MDFTVALAQIKPKLGCVAENLDMVESAIDRGIRENAGMVVFPELALTGYFLKDLVPEVALSLKSPELGRLLDTSQFFINVVDNDFLDHRGKTADQFGYAVFGQVVEGIEVVDAIKGVKTGNKGGHSDVPLEPVVIKSMRPCEE